MVYTKIAAGRKKWGMITNEERFIVTICFLQQSKINFVIKEGFIQIIEEDEVKSLIPIEEITATLTQSISRIEAGKKSRKERFDDLLGREIPIYIPIQTPGHFSLLAIDPVKKVFRYIDSLKNSSNGDLPVIEKLDETYNPQKDLFDSLRESLREKGFTPSATKYKAQQYSKTIHREKIEIQVEGIRDSSILTPLEKEAQLRDLIQETRATAHDDECGFIVAANITSMILSGDIEAPNSIDQSATSDKFIRMRPSFDRLFATLRERSEFVSDFSSPSLTDSTSLEDRVVTKMLNDIADKILIPEVMNTVLVFNQSRELFEFAWKDLSEGAEKALREFQEVAGHLTKDEFLDHYATKALKIDLMLQITEQEDANRTTIAQQWLSEKSRIDAIDKLGAPRVGNEDTGTILAGASAIRLEKPPQSRRQRLR